MPFTYGQSLEWFGGVLLIKKNVNWDAHPKIAKYCHGAVFVYPCGCRVFSAAFNSEIIAILSGNRPFSAAESLCRIH